MLSYLCWSIFCPKVWFDPYIPSLISHISPALCCCVLLHWFFSLNFSVFAEIDRDGSSSIDKRELSDALKKLRIDISSRDVDDLFRRFDVDNNGRLNYNEYLELLGFKNSSRDLLRDRDRRWYHHNDTVSVI